MKCSQYSIKDATEQDILHYLLKCSENFEPNLDQSVDLKEFAKKICDNAITFEAWNSEKLIGLVSAYFNNFETRNGYINHVSVLKEYQGRDIAKKLLSECIIYGKQKGFISISLEVSENNTVARNMYEKYGFTVDSCEKKIIKMMMNLQGKLNEQRF